MKVLFFTAPYCAPCRSIEQYVKDTTINNGHTLEAIDVSTSAGKNAASVFEIIVTPEIVILNDAGEKLAHLKGAEHIQANLDKIAKNYATTTKDNTTTYLIIGGAVLVAAMFLLKRKKRGIGRIVSSRNPEGKSVCRNGKRSTAHRRPGACSKNGGLNTCFMDKEYKYNRRLKQSYALNGAKSVTKKKR